MSLNANWVVPEKTQADCDLERALELFDTALTSKDERVINALRSLMMIVTLTAAETEEAELGPLRAMQRDIQHVNDRLRKVENMLSRAVRGRDRDELDDIRFSAVGLK